MGKRKNRARRRHHDQPVQAHAVPAEISQSPGAVIHEKTPPVLRLVQPERSDVPGEPDAARLAGPPLRTVQEPSRSAGNGAEAARGNHVAAAVDTGLDEASGPLVARSFDAADINAIINHPEIFAQVAVPGMEAIDVAPLLADPRNVLLMADGGGILFIADIEPGIYEVHTNFLPDHRGVHAIKASLQAYRWMFTHTDCMTLQTRVPAFNKGAEQFCRTVGAHRDFERKAVWPTKDGAVDLSFWSMPYHDWLYQSYAVVRSGKAFHKRLDEEYARHAKPAHTHAEEDCHDRHVGACVEMIYGGQPEKAVILYNRWARFAGYQPIALVSRSPIVIDIGEALLQITGDTFKVVLCR